MFDRRAEFEKIEELLNQVRIQCNRAMIPFIWVAAVSDDGKQTGYQVAIDENRKRDSGDKKYVCSALVPGSMEVSLADDEIKDIVKVLNGFKVVPGEPLPAVSPEDFSYGSRMGDGCGYERDEEGIYIGTREKDETSGDSFIAIDFKPNGDLPVIDEDFS